MSSNDQRLKEFTDEMATSAIQKLNIDFTREKFDEPQLRKGIKEEYEEHLKTIDGEVTMAARIAIDHLNKGIPDYYDRLSEMETEALTPNIVKHDDDTVLPDYMNDEDDLDSLDPTKIRGSLTRKKRKSQVGAPSIIKSFDEWDENEVTAKGKLS